ncbi:hypothetical protein ACFFSY_10450 [Paenibacillus aurantiacus]|uniref:YobI-like P-loop NTPase domain-containing protein n=1 Tax=Paenibacillus aurantiacus TaxID=1936118 RepID=A0ABV5KMA3_9BACL
MNSEKKLESEKNVSPNLKLQKLTPTSIETIDIYEESLNFVFAEDDLLNIALTGPYSAGKSSVIKSYEEKYSEKKIIHVSLASFEDTQKNEANNETNAKLEGKILNQLIHQVDPQNIPQTRFKVKSDISKRKINGHTFLLGMFILQLFYLFNLDNWSALIAKLQDSWFKETLGFTTSSLFYILVLGVCVLIFIKYLHSLIQINLQKPIIKRVKIQNHEIEIFDHSDMSHFDKHLDEIVYLFKNAKVDAIVFEDIDRYDHNLIFSKLREINFLINKKTKTPIRFFYLVRDDIFNSKDRTKFFDFIIPIVPILDSSNSIDQLIKYFQEGNILEHFDRTFLERLSLYIDDMRILKNIYNEYVIYHGRIQTTELDENKLLSLIVYKNIFPKDFSELQVNSGFVAKIFRQKSVYISERIHIIDQEIIENMRIIDDINREKLNDIDELDAIFFNGGHQIRVDNNFLDYIKNIKHNPNHFVNIHGNHINFQAKYDQMLQNPEYQRRKQIIEKKIRADILTIEARNNELNYERVRINSTKLRDIIKKENLSYFFPERNVEDHSECKDTNITTSPYYDLIVFLVRNGHIDESYSDYMTYFYAESLSKTDKIFIRSITDEKPKNYDFDLKSPASVVSRLREGDFEQEEVLNFSLLDYLLETKHQFLFALLHQVSQTKNINFVWGYFQRGIHEPSFVYEINKSWNSIWTLILESSVDMRLKKSYMVATLNYSAEDDIKKMNNNECMTNYIANDPDFLSIESPIEVNKIINGLLVLDVHFPFLNYQVSNKELFTNVYRNELFILNIPMIETIIENVYQIERSSDYKTKLYSLICSRPDEPLYSYIHKNINSVIKLICEYTDIKDEEYCVINILNNSELSPNLKGLYISKLHVILKSLIEISEDFWEELVSRNLIESSVENILCYYTKNGLSETIVRFINRSPNDLIFNYEEVIKLVDESIASNFYFDIIQDDSVNDEKYSMILEHYHHYHEEFNFKEIHTNKIRILITLGIISMSKKNLLFMRMEYSSCILLFIEKNILTYIKILDEEIYDKSEVRKVLSVQSIEDENKMKILNQIRGTESISIRGSNYSERIQTIIIESFFDIEDLDFLIDEFQKYSLDMKMKIIELCVEHINVVATNEKGLFDELLLKLLSREDIEINIKLKLLINNLETISYPQIIKYFNIIGLEEFIHLLSGKRPKIEANSENKTILLHFKEKGWISSFDFDPQNREYYRAVGRKLSVKL